MSVIDCLRCHGAGETLTGETDPETNWPTAEPCSSCAGEGFHVEHTTELRKTA